MVEPAEPACPCCYYTYSEGMPPGCGWFVGHWAPDCGSYTWTWSNHEAPHWTGVYEVPACQILNTGASWLFPELEGPAGAAAVPWDHYRDTVYEAWGWNGEASDDEDDWEARGWVHWRQDPASDGAPEVPAQEGTPAPEDGQGAPAHDGGHGDPQEPASGHEHVWPGQGQEVVTRHPLQSMEIDEANEGTLQGSTPNVEVVMPGHPLEGRTCPQGMDLEEQREYVQAMMHSTHAGHEPAAGSAGPTPAP